MEDLFLFTKSEVTLPSIAELADAKGYPHKIITYQGHSDLNVYYNAKAWVWAKMSEQEGDYGGFEPTQLDIAHAYAPLSAFIVSFHPDSLQLLADFIESFLRLYGGWLGWGTSDFEPVYTAENIRDLTFPFASGESIQHVEDR